LADGTDGAGTSTGSRSRRRLAGTEFAAALVREVSARLAREKGARRITALVEKAHPDALGFWDSMESEGYLFDPRIVRCVKTVEASPAVAASKSA
jgi:hypothetical protein